MVADHQSETVVVIAPPLPQGGWMSHLYQVTQKAPNISFTSKGLPNQLPRDDQQIDSVRRMC